MAEQVPAEQWREWVEENQAVILDVRQPHEWDQGTLPGSVLISMGELLDRLEEFDPDRPMLVVCRSGNRSNQVAVYLSMIGYQRVANMAGGLHVIGMQD